MTMVSMSWLVAVDAGSSPVKGANVKLNNTVMDILDVIERIHKGEDFPPKVLGAIVGLRHCRVNAKDGTSVGIEYCFTLRDWDALYEKAEGCTAEEMIEFFPDLTYLVQRAEEDDIVVDSTPYPDDYE